VSIKKRLPQRPGCNLDPDICWRVGYIVGHICNCPLKDPNCKSVLHPLYKPGLIYHINDNGKCGGLITHSKEFKIIQTVDNYSIDDMSMEEIRKFNNYKRNMQKIVKSYNRKYKEKYKLFDRISSPSLIEFKKEFDRKVWGFYFELNMKIMVLMKKNNAIRIQRCWRDYVKRKKTEKYYEEQINNFVESTNKRLMKKVTKNMKRNIYDKINKFLKNDFVRETYNLHVELTELRKRVHIANYKKESLGKIENENNEKIESIKLSIVESNRIINEIEEEKKSSEIVEGLDEVQLAYQQFKKTNRVTAKQKQLLHYMFNPPSHMSKLLTFLTPSDVRVKLVIRHKTSEKEIVEGIRKKYLSGEINKAQYINELKGKYKLRSLPKGDSYESVKSQPAEYPKVLDKDSMKELDRKMGKENRNIILSQSEILKLKDKIYKSKTEIMVQTQIYEKLNRKLVILEKEIQNRDKTVKLIRRYIKNKWVDENLKNNLLVIKET
jgi:hypothetical protein